MSRKHDLWKFVTISVVDLVDIVFWKFTFRLVVLEHMRNYFVSSIPRFVRSCETVYGY